MTPDNFKTGYILLTTTTAKVSYLLARETSSFLDSLNGYVGNATNSTQSNPIQSYTKTHNNYDIYS